MKMLDFAKAYIKKGISVIPVGPDKHPVIPEWKEYQNRHATEEELQNWWGKNPDWGIAIVTGRISNLAVVDVDVKHGGTTEALPPTLVAKTQSGGWHFYYRYINGLRNAVNARQGVDIRSDGGYVVAPPTIGLNGDYKWVIVEEPQPFPAEILKATYDKPKADWESIAEGVAEGGRNNTAAQYIGKLLTAFRPEEWESAVWLTVLNWNKANKPPLSESELRATFNSIVAKERRRVQNEDDAPIVLLSDAAKKFQTDITSRHETGYSVLDESLGGGLTDGDLVLIVGQSGEGKTTVAQTLTHNLLNVQAHSVWFSFEVTVAELWHKFANMGLKEDVPIYTPERYVHRTITWIKKKILEARDIHKCKVVVIDHLGFLVGEYEGSGEKGMKGLNNNLASVYGMICRDLKTIAVQENIIIVLLWHTRKLAPNKTEATGDDIKESSGVLQECDVALSVSRERITANNKYSKEAVEDVFGPNSFIKMLKNRRTGILKRFRCEFKDGKIIQSINDDF